MCELKMLTVTVRFSPLPPPVSTCLEKVYSMVVTSSLRQKTTKPTLCLSNDRSPAWLGHGVQGGDQGHEAEGPQGQERGLDLSPQAEPLLPEAPCDLGPTAHCHLDAGLGCSPKQDRTAHH